MITCVLRGHNFANEVQVTTQIFFPCEKFAFAKTSAETGYTIESEVEASGTHAYVLKDRVQISHFFLDFNNKAKYINERRIVMLAVFHALKKIMQVHTPWGALTGIRPSKLVREWLHDGCDNEKIIATLKNPFCVSEEKARLALAVAHAENHIASRIIGTRGLYVSIPFCPSRCVYCSFNTALKPASEDFLSRYIDALISEIRKKSSREKFSSIYIGGGTPTFLSENLLERLLAAICENFSAEEFTAEAGRPDTLTAPKLKILRKYGVNRLAVNPQTLNDHTLLSIGRNHTADDFFTAFRLAREHDFTCINTDLIAGLPGETADDMRRNMEALQKLRPENITVHTLAVKRASRLNELRHENFKQPQKERINSKSVAAKSPESAGAAPPMPFLIECATEEMLSVAATYCEESGLSPYYLYRQKNMVSLSENTGYSLPSHECLYNVGMMAELQTIIGVGAGAVSKFITGDKITREFNAKNPEIYIQRVLGGTAP
jgi:oxygen-independent coproporphyrinogen-3 oxidase